MEEKIIFDDSEIENLYSDDSYKLYIKDVIK